MTGLTTLPREPQTRQGLDPLSARVLLAGFPKAGKTTLLADWAPDTTLIIDTHHGTDLLDGEHFVQHVSSWQQFAETVDLIANGTHHFKTVGIDLIDDVYKMADSAAAAKHGKKAAALVDWGKGTAEAEAMFRESIGQLLASPVGLWFLSHTDTDDNEGTTRYVPRLDKRVRTYVEGACQYILLAETLGPRRQLRTAPTARFQAGARTPLPDPMPMDARGLYTTIATGLKTPPASKPAKQEEKTAA